MLRRCLYGIHRTGTAMIAVVGISLGGYESRWKIEFGFEYFTGNHERRHLEEGISISFACTVYMY